MEDQSRKCSECSNYTPNVWTGHCSEECKKHYIRHNYRPNQSPFARIRELTVERDKLKQVLKEVYDEALRAYKDDTTSLMAAPPGNPNNCWAEHTKHTQTFGWMVDKLKELLE